MMCVVGWMNEALSKAVDKETLYNVTKRNDEGFVDQHRISNLSRGEMSAYRVAGVLNATQIVLNALISQGFKVTVKAPAAQSEKAV